jgi:hypothetical protein
MILINIVVLIFLIIMMYLYFCMLSDCYKDKMLFGAIVAMAYIVLIARDIVLLIIRLMGE